MNTKANFLTMKIFLGLLVVGAVSTATAQAQHFNHQSRIWIPQPQQDPYGSQHFGGFGYVQSNWIDCTGVLGLTGEIGNSGLVIRNVIPGSEASRIGLHPGDTITRVEGYRIGNVQDWESAMAAGRGIPTFHVRKYGRRKEDRVVANLNRIEPHPVQYLPRQYNPGVPYSPYNPFGDAQPAPPSRPPFRSNTGPQFPQGNQQPNPPFRSPQFNRPGDQFGPSLVPPPPSFNDYRSQNVPSGGTFVRNDAENQNRIQFGISFGR